LFGSDGTNTYLVAANNSTVTVNAQFTLPISVTANSATLVYDGYNPSTGNYQARTVGLTAGTGGLKILSDTFTQYQVHIYQLGGSGTAPTNTVVPSATNTATATTAPTFQPPTTTKTAIPAPTNTNPPPIPPSPTKTSTPQPTATQTATSTPSSTNA